MAPISDGKLGHSHRPWPFATPNSALIVDYHQAVVVRSKVHLYEAECPCNGNESDSHFL